MHVCALGAQVLTCVPGMCGVRGWQPKPAPPAPAAPAAPGSNPCSSSSQATPWTQPQVVRGRGSRATDGALRPTPTAPRQVGLIPAGPCQAALPLNWALLGLAFQPGACAPGSACVDAHEHTPAHTWARVCSPAHTLLGTRVGTWHVHSDTLLSGLCPVPPVLGPR